MCLPDGNMTATSGTNTLAALISRHPVDHPEVLLKGAEFAFCSRKDNCRAQSLSISAHCPGQGVEQTLALCEIRLCIRIVSLKFTSPLVGYIYASAVNLARCLESPRAARQQLHHTAVERASSVPQRMSLVVGFPRSVPSLYTS